eukprot:2942112-Alexandrium_andersonii.AAC.1
MRVDLLVLYCERASSSLLVHHRCKQRGGVLPRRRDVPAQSEHPGRPHRPQRQEAASATEERSRDACCRLRQSRLQVPCSGQ